jgi:hypothetical protein
MQYFSNGTRRRHHYFLHYLWSVVQVELEDKIGHDDKKSHGNDNYKLKDLSYGKDNSYYKSTDSSSIIKINCINNNINIFDNIISLADYSQQ